MQRQIKFRAWDGSQMLDMWKIETCFYWEGGCGSLQTFLDKLSDYVFMQFTGLLDRNGKEVYHGDILGTNKNNYVVDWQPEEARFFLAPQRGTYQWKFMDECPGMEIIGNVYENSELLTPLP